MKSKGQVSLEYVAAMLFVIFVLAFILFNASDQVPDIRQNNDRASVNLEARSLTSTLLDNPGSHSFGSGGDNWEKNTSTRDNANEVGFASEYHVVERDKIMALDTVGDDVLNYSQFRNLSLWQISRFVFYGGKNLGYELVINLRFNLVGYSFDILPVNLFKGKVLNL